MPRFLTSESKEALSEAVSRIEASSAAEVVILVKPSSANYLHIDLCVGMAVAALALAFFLYSPWYFAWHYILAGPFWMLAAAALLSSRLPGLQRVLSNKSTMQASVQRAAKAAFVEAGVHNTHGRTGILVYVSTLERSVEVVADSAVSLAFPAREFDAFVASLHQHMQRGGGASGLARKMTEAAERFAKYVPQTDEDDDPNELPDGVIE